MICHSFQKVCDLHKSKIILCSVCGLDNFNFFFHTALKEANEKFSEQLSAGKKSSERICLAYVGQWMSLDD